MNAKMVPRTMVVPTTAKFARPLAKMQSVIFPTLTENELLRN